MTKRLVLTAGALALTLGSLGAFAQDGTPVGVWKTIDDESGKPKSLIRISEVNGELRGTIEKLYREPGEDPNPKCEKCEGPLKDQPVVGMTILTGMKKDGTEYNGGQIVDPKNGKTYKSKMTVVNGGKKLDVRGYIGVPMLGRTQTWERVE